MKNFTLLALAMMTMSTAAQAQVKKPLLRAPFHTVSPIDKLKAQLGFPVKSHSASSILRAPALSKADKAKLAIKLFEAANADNDSGKYIYLAKHREEYFPVESEDGDESEESAESADTDASAIEWELGGTYDITYDDNGRILQELYDDGETVLRTTNTWTSKGKLSEEIQAVSEDGGETFTNSSRRVQSYDSYFPQLTTSKVKYTWNANLNTWSETGDAFRRRVTRDADKNVTGLTLAVPYNGAYDIITRITNTFDPTTKQAVTHKTEDLKATGDNTFAFQESYYLTDMKWYKTNGQLVTSPEEWLDYGNKLSSATFKSTDEDGTETGTISGVYSDTDEGYVITENFDGDDDAYECTSLEFTDENGSYKYLSGEYSADGVMTSGSARIVKHDANGNLCLEESYEWNDDTNELELIEGTRYDITYDEEIPTAQKSVVVYQYDYDAQDYSSIPEMRLDYSDFVKVTGIHDAVKSNSAAVNAPTEYYNLQGIRTLNPSRGGVYLMKQGGVVRKVIK